MRSQARGRSRGRAQGQAADLARARTWATVDLDAVAHNVRVLRGLLPPTAAFMAVVKADAYGHGAVPVAASALAAGAAWLGVATPGEALELRDAGIEAPILILGPVPAVWLPRVVAADCVLSVTGSTMVPALRGLAGPRRPRVHVKVDTGMTRLGIEPETLPSVLDLLDDAGAVVEGLWTHLACADEPDPTPTRQQLAAFEACARLIRARIPGVLCHAANSAAVVGFSEAAYDLVRVGIALYGVSPASHLRVRGLRPVMTLTSRVVRARRVPEETPVSYGATYRAASATTIVTVPVGYADGYPRVLSNRGAMRVGGRTCTVAGRVCMDYTMLDVGDGRVEEGDEVTVFGDGLPVEDVAEAAGTIAHEVLCRVGLRVPRVYLRDGRVVEESAWGEAGAD